MLPWTILLFKNGVIPERKEFAHQEQILYFKMGSSLKEKNLLLRSKFFTLRVDPIKQEEKMKMKACFPHESVPIYIKSYPLR